MAFLRRKLKCFYCGKASDLTWKPGLSSFQCKICEAVNYLDANGAITDPPTSEVSLPVSRIQYARPLFSSQSPAPVPLSGAPGSVFCHTCTSNQQFVTQALAEYLPSTKDPRYREYEKNLPNYKRQLEARYPQVCPDCEPRMKAQIRAAGYTARSDYVRRMNDKSKQTHTRAPFLTSRRLIGVVAGLLWLCVLSLHIIWNVLALAVNPTDGLKSEEEVSLRSCLVDAFRGREVEHECLEQAIHWVPWMLALNVLTLWWNPILLRSTRRAKGVGEFYRLQLLLLVLRFAFWYAFATKAFIRYDHDMSRAAHGVMLMMNIAITFVSVRTAQPMPHIVRFHKEGETLGHEDVGGPAQQSANLVPVGSQNSSTKNTTSKKTQKASFPIEDLGNKQIKSVDAPLPPVVRYNSPTPPPELNDTSDAMDVDTPENAKRIVKTETSVYRDSANPEIRLRSSQRGSFLPPAPLQPAPARQLRSRSRKTKGPLDRKESFSSNWDLETIASQTNDDDALTVGGDDDIEDNFTYNRAFVPAAAKGAKAYQFKEASFHAQEDDTGLEGMLGFFGLKDDPLETAPSLEVTGDTKTAYKDTKIFQPQSDLIPGFGTWPKGEAPAQISPSLPIPLVTAPVFFLSLFAMMSLKTGLNWMEYGQIAGLIWCIAIGVARAIDALNPNRQIWELSSVLAFVTESGLALLLIIMKLNEIGEAKNVAATATGPNKPTVSPDTDILDQMEGFQADGAEQDWSVPSTGFKFDTVVGALMIWVSFQELVIAYRNLTPKVKISSR